MSPTAIRQPEPHVGADVGTVHGAVGSVRDDCTISTNPASSTAGGGWPPAGMLAGGRFMAHTGPVRARVGAWFDGAGWFVGTAVALFVIALIVVLGESQSPDAVLWTGHRVVGTEQGGIVSYRWHGQNHSLDAPGYGSSKAVGVYLDPGDPNHAAIDNLASRAPVALLVGGPLTGGVALLAVGLTRGYRWRRREMRGVVPTAGYGHGLDPEFVTRHLRELRRDDKDVQRPGDAGSPRGGAGEGVQSADAVPGSGGDVGGDAQTCPAPAMDACRRTPSAST